MKNRCLIILGLGLLLSFLCAPSLSADPLGNPRKKNTKRPITWSNSAHRSSGLYTTTNPSVAHGVSLSANAIYYYGDIDMLDMAFIHGFQPQNLSVGGQLNFGYLQPAFSSANWRFTLGGGYLHGNDSARFDMNPTTQQLESAGKGLFTSYFVEGNAGLEWYPFPRAGFYLYAGLGLAVSIVNYDFYKVNKGHGTKVCVLPMLPLEIGYNFNLTHGFFLTLDLSVHQGLMDFVGCSLDAWPIVKSSRFQWGDGYFQIGLTFSYRWSECEVCRLYRW